MKTKSIIFTILAIFAIFQSCNKEKKILEEKKQLIIGPSMGGMIGRFGLSYMEVHNMRHDVSVFIPADSPHRGANIPLGMQWVSYLYTHLNEEDDAYEDEKKTIKYQNLIVFLFLKLDTFQLK